MKLRPYLFHTGLFGIGVVVGFIVGIQQPEMGLNDVTEYLSTTSEEKLLKMYPWIRPASVTRVGRYLVFSDSMPDANLLFVPVVQGGRRSLSFERDRILIGVDVTTPEFVEIKDNDSDGILETISYDILDGTGNTIGIVYDFDRDGTPDMKTLRKGAAKEGQEDEYLNISGAWFPSSFRDGACGIVEGGTWKPVRKVGEIGKHFELLEPHPEP